MNLNQHIQSVFAIHSEEEFEKLALQTFRFQYENVAVYRKYADMVQRSNPQSLAEIPFLPIDFFKHHEIRSHKRLVEVVFKSSGTTQQVRSVHQLEDKSLYEKSFEQAYRQFVGNPEEQIIIALLPNYVEQQFSGLVYMVKHLIQKTQNELSDFYLYDTHKIQEVYRQALEQNKQIVLFGVTYALLDLAEDDVQLPKIKVIETGGMKGRRKEMSKTELHEILKNKLQVSTIFSEHGMCELLSQAYSEGTHFETPNWLKILIRDKNDPFSYIENGKTGGVNVIDLANIYSCSFIQTQDLGRKTNTTFEILGRMDNTELRGCNLMIGE
ncbi:MAG TPA: acyl transferase [Crocinitomicaceae bacterium]|nr:acyl transferase [Crocinitomicaceae bacterium]